MIRREVEGEDPQAFHWHEAAGVVEVERCGVARFRLNGHADGPSRGCRLPHGAQQRTPGTVAPGSGHDIKIPKLPEPTQPQRGRHGDRGGDTYQFLAGVSGKDGQHSGPGVLREPGERPPWHRGLTVVLAVLVEDFGHVSKLNNCRVHQLGHHRNHELKLQPGRRWPCEAEAAARPQTAGHASSGDVRNARAVICLAESDPVGTLDASHDVLDGTAPVLGYVTIVEAHLLAALAHRELGDQHAANEAVERALALAESDRLVLPFAMTGARECSRRCPGIRPRTARCSPTSSTSARLISAAPGEVLIAAAEELSLGELRVLRYLPTNLSRPEIAGELSVSLNTVSTHVRRIYAKLQVRDRSSAVQRARNCGCWPLPGRASAQAL
jgi:DNA-binding CsgD family transcriptional regulator